MKLMTDEQSLALHELSRRHGIPSEAVFEIASWGYRMGARDMREKAADAVDDTEVPATENEGTWALIDASKAIRSLPIEDEA